MPDNFTIPEGAFGVQDFMTNGLVGSRCNVDVAHPLVNSEIKVKSHASLIN